MLFSPGVEKGEKASHGSGHAICSREVMHGRAPQLRPPRIAAARTGWPEAKMHRTYFQMVGVIALGFVAVVYLIVPE